VRGHFVEPVMTVRKVPFSAMHDTVPVGAG
jgi:hypothetical protein